MLQGMFDPGGYFFWLLVVSGACCLLEALVPWRRQQRQLRRQLGQDLFWLVFNGHFAGLGLGMLVTAALRQVPALTDRLQTPHLLAGLPAWLQFALYFVTRDLLEWCVHNALHRVRWLWVFHRLHHSIVEMDWIGNFRFHWMEIVIYRSITHIPLLALGLSPRLGLAVAVLVTAIGHLNHSNINLTWGPLRYVFNSPRMHIWHHMHDLPPRHPHGVNFGVALSIWDWLLGTAYWPGPESVPAQQPARLGFPGMHRFPSDLLTRLIHPIPLARPRPAKKER